MWKMATGKELDELLQYENWDDKVDNNKWDGKHNNVNTNDDADDKHTLHIYDCVAFHNMHTHKYIHWMHVVSHFLVHISSHSHWLKSCTCPPHCHPHTIHVRDLFTLISTLYFLAFLLPLLLLPSQRRAAAGAQQEDHGKPALLRDQRGWGHQRRPLPPHISKRKNWNPWENCHKYALKLLYNAHTWRVLEDLVLYGQWINLHDRSQNVPKACDKRWCHLISYIHHTCEYKQYCHVGNTAKQCRLGLFEDSDFAGDLEDSKSTPGGTLCVFGSHTFVPISWMFQKQTSFSHSSTESEINFLDAGLRLYGIPALDSGDLIVSVLHWKYQSKQERGDPYTNLGRVNPHQLPTRKKFHGMIGDLDNVDLVSSNANSFHKEAWLCFFEDNEAVIKMMIMGRSPTMRHVSRTHTVALDWLFGRINLDTKNPNQIHWHQKPTRRHTDKGKFHTWWMESSFCVCLTLAISVLPIVLKWCRKERKKMQVKKESQQNRSRWWI